MNLRGIFDYTVSEQFSKRSCPVCNVALDTITINGINNFEIERCSSCMGLFFDPEELTQLLDRSVDSVYSVNVKKLWHLNQLGALEPNRAAYIKCPVCSSLMNRVNFGARSGVVIDQCKHGVWLDNGELRKLLEWRKAGGQLHNEQVLAQKSAREEKKRREEQKKLSQLKSESWGYSSSSFTTHQSGESEIELGAVLQKAVKIIGKLFI